MLIRCEKCNTLYELDEKLLPPGGAPVQCSKCQFVFKAFPNLGPEAEATRDAGPGATRSKAGDVGSEAATAAQVQGASAEPLARGGALSALEEEGAAGVGGGSRESPPEPEPNGAGGQATHASARASPAAAPEEPHFTVDGRPIRKVPFPVEEPSAPSGPRPVLGRVPGGRPIGPSGMNRRWAMVAVPIALALVITAIIVWLLLGRHADPAAPARPEGHSVLLPARADEPSSRTAAAPRDARAAPYTRVV